MQNPIEDSTFQMGLKELNNSDGWYLEVDGVVKVWSKVLFPECDLSAFKAQVVLKRPIDLAMRAFWDHDSREKYLDNIKKSKKILQGQDFDICYQITSPPVPFVSDRETILARTWKKVDGGFDIVSKSVKHDDYPENDTYARTEIVFQAVNLRVHKENPDWCDIVAINQMNGKKFHNFIL